MKQNEINELKYFSIIDLTIISSSEQFSNLGCGRPQAYDTAKFIVLLEMITINY